MGDGMAMPEKKGLASMFGKAPVGKPAGAGSDPMASESEYKSEGSGVPPDFEDYAATAFPDLEGDAARMKALYQAVKACK